MRHDLILQVEPVRRRSSSSHCHLSVFTFRLPPGAPIPSELELQSSFARRIGQRLDAAVIEIAAAVEHDLLDALLLARARRSACRLPWPQRRCRRSSLRPSCIEAEAEAMVAVRVVDELRVDVVQRAIDVQRGRSAVPGIFSRMRVCTRWRITLRLSSAESSFVFLPSGGAALRRRSV